MSVTIFKKIVACCAIIVADLQCMSLFSARSSGHCISTQNSDVFF